jgi:hypothetical protein
MTISPPDNRHLDDLDRFLIKAAIEIGAIADDVGGAMTIFAYYADGDDCGIGPSHFMAALECSPSKYMEGIGILDRVGIAVPAAWRLS